MSRQADEPIPNDKLIAAWQTFAESLRAEGRPPDEIANAALTVALQLNTLTMGSHRAVCHFLQVGAMMAKELELARIYGGGGKKH